MSDFARVDSVAMLKDFRASLCRFAEQSRAGLDEVDGGIQRTMIWVSRDQHAFWKGQIPRRAEDVMRAKLELARKRDQKTPLGGTYSTVEERKALAAAKRRLEEAETKFANVRRWTRRLEQETSTYKGGIRGLSHALDHDIPRAVARLDNMIAALEAYASVRAEGTQEESMARPPTVDEGAEDVV